MKTQRHFGNKSENALREAAKIRTMVVDLDRIVQLLERDIVTEEERSRVSDRSLAAYPVLARTLAAHRDNLKVAIAALEKRFKKIMALPEAVAA
jgi:hypothetical protein